MSAKKFKGDLTTLNLVGVFRNLGLECRESTPGKFHVECPWAHEHSKTGKTDTVIWQEGGKWPTFNCSHAHCDGRNIETVIEWAESMQRGIIDAHCSQGFRPGYKRQNDYSKSTRQAKAERPIVQPFRASGQRAVPTELARTTPIEFLQRLYGPSERICITLAIDTEPKDDKFYTVAEWEGIYSKHADRFSSRMAFGTR